MADGISKPTKADRSCFVCGEQSGTRKFCSDDCKWVVRNRMKCVECGGNTGWSHTDKRAVAPRCTKCRQKTKKPIHIRKDGKPMGSGPQTFRCCRCGQDWQRAAARGQAPKWCPSCRHMAAFERRRAREKKAFVQDVNRAKVFAADGYRCHLCGDMTDKSKQAPHPLAPTIDHVIPLSVGGKHEPTNCRTAHSRCNSAKNNRGGGEQMLLLTV